MLRIFNKKLNFFLIGVVCLIVSPFLYLSPASADDKLISEVFSEQESIDDSEKQEIEDGLDFVDDSLTKDIEMDFQEEDIEIKKADKEVHDNEDTSVDTEPQCSDQDNDVKQQDTNFQETIDLIATKAPKMNGWYSEGNSYYFYKNDVKQKGWVVNNKFWNYGLQRYWLDKTSGALVINKLIDKSVAGYFAYATRNGYVVRGKYKANASTIYLANNDGKLENPGWVVTKKYDGGWQRYWIDSKTRGAKLGFFRVNKQLFHGDGNLGYVVRGKTPYGKGVLLSDNGGVLYEGKTGWLVTKKYDGGWQRYWMAKVCEGYIGAKAGWFKVYGQQFYGVSPYGYVFRNDFKVKGSSVMWADNGGVLTHYVKKCCNSNATSIRIARLWKDTLGGLWGDKARRAFDYVKGFRYVNGSKYPSGDWPARFAIQMLNKGGGNCYRYAALLSMMLKAVGYSCNAISGEVFYNGGGSDAHGWVEVKTSSGKVVCDPQLAHRLPGYNWYWIRYGSAPFSYHKF